MAWWAIQATARRPPAVAHLQDRHAPVPDYPTDDRIDPDACTVLSRQIAARQRENGPKGDDIDTMFRSVASREAVFRVDEPTVVEPHFGWAVLARGLPLHESHYAAALVQSSIGRELFATLPNPASWALAVTVRPPAVQFPAAISLLDWLADNYVHFLDIIINRVRLAEQVGLPSSLPLLLARRVAEKSYCREFLSLNPHIGNRVVVIDEQVRVDQLYLIRTPMDAKESYDFTRSLVPTPAPDGSDRLFLIRRAGAVGRAIENEDEVADVCSRFGFTSYDPAAEPLVRQAERLAHARFVVSTHGAGLSNIMFRAGAPLGVLELFPSGTIRDHFFILSRHYGYEYHAQVGASAPHTRSLLDINRGSFHVDIPSFVRNLDRLTSAS